MGNENWCMSGYHAVSVLADAITKGVFSNVDEALSAMVSTSTVPYYEGVADYMKLGYIPLDKSGTAASSTLEYAYDDWTIYQTALKAGKLTAKALSKVIHGTSPSMYRMMCLV